MEDVVLHYRSGPAEGLSSLLETSEKLLEPFSCRPPPVFRRWFPAAADRHRPIRPEKAAPVISSSDLDQSESRTAEDQSESRTAEVQSEGRTAEDQSEGRTSEDQSVSWTSEDQSESRTAEDQSESRTAEVQSKSRTAEVQSESRTAEDQSESGTAEVQSESRTAEDQSESGTAEVQSESRTSEDQSEVRRSWSVFRQTDVLLQSSMSKRFLHMVTEKKLHLRQRVKWIIRRKNLESSRDMEQVWRTLIRSPRSSGLPSFNANIQRQRAEIWVFCDVVNGEQVGRHLKEQLKLKGSISLTVRRLGNVFSL